VIGEVRAPLERLGLHTEMGNVARKAPDEISFANGKVTDHGSLGEIRVPGAQGRHDRGVPPDVRARAMLRLVGEIWTERIGQLRP